METYEKLKRKCSLNKLGVAFDVTADAIMEFLDSKLKKLVMKKDGDFDSFYNEDEKKILKYHNRTKALYIDTRSIWQDLEISGILMDYDTSKLIKSYIADNYKLDIPYHTIIEI